MIWTISDWKSELSAARSEVESEVSDASSVLALIWFRRSDTVCPVETATSRTEEARFSESVTAPSEETWERWLWAMFQIAPSSRAPPTLRPVDTSS